MSDIRIPDAAVEAAFNAWCDVADVDEWRVRNSQEALRAAIAAALPEILEEAQWQTRIVFKDHETIWMTDDDKQRWTDRGESYREEATTETVEQRTLYRIKDPT